MRQQQSNFSILVADDDSVGREEIGKMLKCYGNNLRVLKESCTIFSAITERLPTVIICNIMLRSSHFDSLGILEIIKKKYPDMPVIFVYDEKFENTAVNGLKMGAFYSMKKPLNFYKVNNIVRKAIEYALMSKENVALRARVGVSHHIIGGSASVNRLKENIERVAGGHGRVFIRGEKGTGKEEIARYIHKASPRAIYPFDVLYTRDETTEKKDLEAKLFGTIESENVNDPPREEGILERCNGGTLFIDDLTAIPLALQGKLLNFLQSKRYCLKNSNRELFSDVRVIAATESDVEEKVREGKLRQDLFDRINISSLYAPPLRERIEDIKILSENLIEQIARNLNQPKIEISKAAIIAMQAYNWPGNIQQLKNIIEWLMIMNPKNKKQNNKFIVDINLLPQEILNQNSAVDYNFNDAKTDGDKDSNMSKINLLALPLKEARSNFEKQYITSQLKRFNGSISKTANFVGMERSALHRKIVGLQLK